MDGRAADLENILDALLNLARSSNPDRSSGHPNPESLLPYQQLIDHYISPQELSQLHIMNVSVPSTGPSSTSLQQQHQEQMRRHNNPLPDIITSSATSQPKRLPDIIAGVELSNPTVKTATRTRRKLSRKKCCPRVKVKDDTATKHDDISCTLDDNGVKEDGASNERLREDEQKPGSLKGSPQQRRSPRRFRLQGMFHDEHHDVQEYGFREAGSCLRLIADAFHDDRADGVQQEHHHLGQAQHQGHHQRLLIALLRSTSLENVLVEAVAERPILLGLILMSYLYFTNSSL